MLGEDGKDGSVGGCEDGGRGRHEGASGEAERLVRNAGLAFKRAVSISLGAGDVEALVLKGVLGEAVGGLGEVGLEPGAVVEGETAGSADTRRVGKMLGGRATGMVASEVPGERGRVGGVVCA